MNLLKLICLLVLICFLFLINACKKKEIEKPEPTADFSYNFTIAGVSPSTVQFTSKSENAESYYWDFGDNTTSSTQNPKHTYNAAKTYKVKLVVGNSIGKDSSTKDVAVTLDKPKPDFTFTTSSLESLPVTSTFINTSSGSDIQYKWSFGDGDTSSKQNPEHKFTSGGIYNIKLIVTNASGSDSVTQQLRISPYPQAYTDINGKLLNLNAWVGDHVMILSRNNNLNRATMFKWLKVMDTTYGYYRLCTGRDPIPFAPTYIDNHTTIADVPATCGAGCSYIGFTGIEMLNDYFDIMYNGIINNNQYDQVDFYEFGRNFWFYGNQLAYKANDPTTTGFAVYMRFTSINAAGVDGAPFGSWSFETFKTNVENLVDAYVADITLNWSNTLGIGQGVPNSGLGATDLFASFCMRLQRDYGGENFVQNIWKQAGLRPNAVTTQDAVDNFFLASCAAANKNLTALFQSWRWPLSESAVTAASQYQ